MISPRPPWRATGAWIVGGVAGYATASAWHVLLGATPGELEGARLVVQCAVSAGLASLISWHHRPGLPAFTAAGGLVASGWQRRVAPVEFWLVWNLDAIWLVGAFLLAYISAWLVDTQIVFRTLPVRPPPKEVTPRVMLTHLIPCSLVTGAVGLTVTALWAAGGSRVPVALVALAFCAGAAAGVRMFPIVSTLWVTMGAVLAASAIGFLGLSGAWSAAGGLPGRVWEGWTAELFAGAGAAGALLGFWVARGRRRAH